MRTRRRLEHGRHPRVRGSTPLLSSLCSPFLHRDTTEGELAGGQACFEDSAHLARGVGFETSAFRHRFCRRGPRKGNLSCKQVGFGSIPIGGSAHPD